MLAVTAKYMFSDLASQHTFISCHFVKSVVFLFLLAKIITTIAWVAGRSARTRVRRAREREDTHDREPSLRFPRVADFARARLIERLLRRLSQRILYLFFIGWKGMLLSGKQAFVGKRAITSLKKKKTTEGETLQLGITNLI